MISITILIWNNSFLFTLACFYYLHVLLRDECRLQFQWLIRVLWYLPQWAQHQSVLWKKNKRIIRWVYKVGREILLFSMAQALLSLFIFFLKVDRPLSRNSKLLETLRPIFDSIRLLLRMERVTDPLEKISVIHWRRVDRIGSLFPKVLWQEKCGQEVYSFL